MAAGRDDFTRATRDQLAKRVQFLCSQCSCRTVGPRTGDDGVADMGVAAHITAAAPGGPRYDKSLTPSQRRDYDNGIWMCSNHGKLVDADHNAYSVADLREMKRIAEERARIALREDQSINDLAPTLESGVQWLPPRAADDRPGYGQIHHAGFMIGGNRKERGRAYLQSESATAIPANAVIAGENTLQHEWRALIPHVPYRIPALTTTETPGPFWLDQLRGLSDETLKPGTYVTDEAFIRRRVRTVVSKGEHRVRVKLVLGDTRHNRTFFSDWLPFSVL